jgi:hypothetical protein
MEVAMRLFRLFPFFVFLSVIAVQNPTSAAPQIIAVLPTDTGVPFSCAEGICSADLSTYCLQQERPAPKRGAVYLPATSSDFKLVVQTADSTRVLDASKHVSFIESRGFMAIAAVIDERHLQALADGKMTGAALRVGKAASLLPKPVAGDPNPLSVKEIAYVTKWRRQQGVEIVDANPNARAVRVLANLTNRLPSSGPTRLGRVEEIWQKAIGDEFDSTTPPTASPGLHRARIEFQHCSESPSRFSYAGLRNCLEYRHDDLIRDLNIEYWDSKPGS